MKIWKLFFIGFIDCMVIMNAQQKTSTNLPCGLINNGAECYMNSLLQCLTNLNSVMNYAINQKHPKKVRLSIKKTSKLLAALARSGRHSAVYQSIINNNQFNGATLLLTTLTTMHTSARPCNPALFKAWARHYLFHEMHQRNHNDAHEFFTMLLDTLPPELQQLFAIHVIKHNCYCHTANTCSMPLVRLFIPSQTDRISLQDCLSATLTTKYETWHVQQPLPPVFAMLLQRIDAYEQKNMTAIDIQKNLSLQGKKYDLKSMMLHQGNQTEKGHFVALVNKNNSWFVCNDRFVKQCRAEQDVLLQTRKMIRGGQSLAPYVLFYEQESEA